MRHRKHTAKLGRNGEHRNAMLTNLVCSLIRHRRVTTTLAKAKAARPVAEKVLTLAKRGSLHDRRLASSRLRQDEEAVRILFAELAPPQKDRPGGYTRIIKLSHRRGDAAEQAIIEWVEAPMESDAVKTPTSAKKPKAKAKAKPAETKPVEPKSEDEVKAEPVEETKAAQADEAPAADPNTEKAAEESKDKKE